MEILMKRKWFFGLACIVFGLLFFTNFKLFHKKIESKNLDAFICISSEDEKYNVKGGIGTYLGILVKEVKKLYPHAEVFWITKSPTDQEFSEIDEFGVKRHYLSDANPYVNRPFLEHIGMNSNEDGPLLSQQVFHNKVNAKLGGILKDLHGKNVVIECGEWEGIAHQLYRTINDRNILKAVRIHTPLAVTMVSNKLPISATNKLQLLHEFETLDHADCISSCSSYMKDQVIQHVLGRNFTKTKPISVIPHPVDTGHYHTGMHKRSDSIAKVNTILEKEFLQEDTFNIYIIGSVETRKGAELVVNAVAEVAEKLPQARFCFFGHHGGNKSKNLTANTKLPPEVLYKVVPFKYRHQVAFAGYVDHAELPLIIESGDAFPIMYLGDNFPGAVAEIALMEKPILALERGGVIEMLSNESDMMIAYNLGSSLDTASSALATGLLELYADTQRRKEMGQNLGKLIRKKYAPEKVTSDLMRYYLDALAKKSNE